MALLQVLLQAAEGARVSFRGCLEQLIPAKMSVVHCVLSAMWENNQTLISHLAVASMQRDFWIYCYYVSRLDILLKGVHRLTADIQTQNLLAGIQTSLPLDLILCLIAGDLLTENLLALLCRWCNWSKP